VHAGLAAALRGSLRALGASGGQFDLELEITTLKHHRNWVRIIGHLELLDGHPFWAFGSLQNVQAQSWHRLPWRTARAG